MDHTQRQAHHTSLRLAQASLVLLSILLCAALLYDVEHRDALLIGLSIILANLPGMVVLIAASTQQQAAHKIKAQHVHMSDKSSQKRLAHTRYLFTEQTGVLAEETCDVVRLLVGRSEYSPKTASTSTIEIFMNADVLAPHDAKQHLTKTEGLFYSIRQFENQSYVYLSGSLSDITKLCSGLWDHGHSRSLTEADKKFHSEYAVEEANRMHHTVAYAFAPLPEGVDEGTFKLKDVTADILFMGMVSYKVELRRGIEAAMRTANNAHIRVVVFSDDPEPVAGAVAKQATGSDPVVLPESLLNRLKPKQLIAMVDASTVVFCQISAKSKKRIIQIFERHDASLYLGTSPEATSNGRFQDVIRAIRISRQTAENFQSIIRAVYALIPALMILVIASSLLLINSAINPVITPLQIIALVLVGLLPAWIMVGHDISHTNLMKRAPLTHGSFNRLDIGRLLGYGGLIALLALINHGVFFYLRGFDPRFLASDTPLYIQASTLTAVTVLLCMYVHILVNRVDSQKRVFARLFVSNKKLLGAIAGSLITLAVFMYTPALQVLLNVQPLALVDWLSAVIAAGVYLVARLAQRKLRKYTRHEVIKLHHEVHGAK